MEGSPKQRTMYKMFKIYKLGMYNKFLVFVKKWIKVIHRQFETQSLLIRENVEKAKEWGD